MNPVEKLTVEVGLDSSKHDKGADKVLSKNKELEKSAVKVEKSTQNMAIGFTKVARAFTGFIATIAISSGLVRLARDTAKANDELLFLEKNLNLSARSIKNWQGVASAMGGSAQGMTNSLLGLKQAMNGLVMFGDDSMLPYFNALGVNVVDSAGKLRKLDDVFMDIAESLEKMPKDQAYTLAKQMGFDEGTINTLLMGKRELQEMLAIQDKLYKSDKKALEASREFNKQQAIVNAQWQALKTMIADALIPTLTRLMKWAGEFFEFLSRNQKIIKEVFLAASIIIGMILIPMLKAGLVALIAFIAPFAPFLITVGALGVAFIALFNDYKVWAEGGKSLFDWTGFTQQINNAKEAVYGLMQSFMDLTKPMYDAFDKAIPNATDKIGQFATEVMAALGHQPSIEALETNANAEVNGGTYKPQNKGGGASKVKVGGKPSGKQASFKNKHFTKEKAESIARVANQIGVDPNDLAAVISFETAGTFSPSVKNPKSSATGLIQFMSGTGGTKGKYYGMSRDQFSSLSFDEQMQYVKKYFQERGFNGKKKRDVADTYTAVTGYGYKRGSKAYQLNKVWDSNNDGYIEKGEMVRNPSFRAHQRQYYSNNDISTGAEGAKNLVAQSQQLSQIKQGGVNNDNRKYTDVKIGDIKIQTSSNTVSGNTEEALKASFGYMNQLGVSVQ